MVCTVNEIYLDMRQKLLSAGISSAALEAKELLAFAMRVTPDSVFKMSGTFLSEETVSRAISFTNRRLNGEPCAYIIGEWDFYGFTFKITPNVLIPRADTETVIDAFLSLMPDKNRFVRVLDLCCGSGCIGITLAKLYENSRVILMDFSNEALAVSSENITRHRLSSRVYTYKADVFDGWTEIFGTFDAIVSNPPYIPSADIAGLDMSVRAFEPEAALDGGTDGLDFYRAISKKWSSGLAENGYIIAECGFNQAKQVSAVFSENFKNIITSNDFSGITRVIAAQK